MAELRVPGYSEGSDIGGEPVNWVVYDTETNTSHTEWNPNYVPPPPPTEIEQAEQEVYEARLRLAAAETYLKALRNDS